MTLHPNQTNAAQTNESKDSAKIERVPKTLSDTDFSKLQFPKQEFMKDVGKEGLPTPPAKPNLSFHPPPQTEKTSTRVDETEDFKVTRSTKKEEGEPEYSRIESILLKKENLKISIQEPSSIQNSEALHARVSALVAKAEALSGKKIDGCVFNSGLGNLEFTVDDKKFSISPHYALEEKSDSKLKNTYQTEIAKHKEELSALKATLNGVTTTEEYEKRSEALSKKTSEIAKRLNLGLFFEATGNGAGDIEKYSKEDQAILKAISEEKNILNDARGKLLSIEKTKFTIAQLEEKLTTSRYFEGELNDGTKVIASVAKSNNRLEIFNVEGEKIAMEFANYGTVDFQRDLPNGMIEKISTPNVDEDRGKRRELLNSSSEIQVLEIYGKTGALEATSHFNLGYKEEFANGEVVTKIVLNHSKILENFDEILKIEGGKDLITESVKVYGIRDLKTYAQIKSLPDSADLLESGLKVLKIESLERLSKEIGQSLDSDSEFATSDQKLDRASLTQIKETVDFRAKMVRDGTELSMDDSINFEDYNPGPYIWNDPKSRGYFEIKDSFIDWNSEVVKKLIDINAPDLSKKELKLLVARNLFDSERAINPENVSEAIKEIAALREKYGKVELVKDRNIVLAANNERVSTGYGATSQDPHNFGKPALAEALKKINGENRAFTLFREESEIITDQDAINKILAKSIEDQQLRGEIISSLKEKADLRGGSILRKDVLDVLFSKGIEIDQASEIADNLKISPKAKLESMAKTKLEILQAVSDTPRPFTFIFDGHGSPDAIYLSDGQLSANFEINEAMTTVKITPEELAEAINKRNDKFGISQDSSKKDVYVFQNCFNSNFVRKLSEHLKGEDKPIFAGASEFNQVSYYDPGNQYGSLFLSEVILGIDRETDEIRGESTINGVINRQSKELKRFEGEPRNYNTNPGIYVPNEKGEMIQISSLDRPNSFQVG